MNISKISRSLVVVIFVALITFIGYNDIRLIIKNANNNVSLNILKFMYVIALAIFVLLYAYIKGKMYRHKVKRSKAMVFRYLYIFIVVIVMSIVSIYRDFDKISNTLLTIYIAYKIVLAITLKRIIFNVSKSDILSVLGMFAFAMIPSVYIKQSVMISNLTNTLITLLTILVTQKLIDELKQKGVKTKKYIVLSAILGVLVSLCVFVGINVYIWVLLAILSLLITSNLDKTHIYFPKKITSNLNLSLKSFLYKLERVNINKILICIVVIAIVAGMVIVTCNLFFNKISEDNIQSDSVYSMIFIEGKSVFSIDLNSFKTNMVDNTIKVLSLSRTYYLVIIVYIIFIEVLSIFLHRRYDTKSTIIKLLFILMYLSIQIFNLEIIIYQTILSVFLILIAIINTSNIYLNREERVKMLVA